MALFSRSIWPSTVRHPIRRLLLALLLAPGIVAGVLTIAAFVLAGMSEETQTQVVAVTIESGIALFALVYLFALTFGIVGVAVLWMLEQSGFLAWAVTGIFFGTAAGLLFGELIMDGIDRILLLIFALAGMAVFIVLRWIAGIQDEMIDD